MNMELRYPRISLSCLALLLATATGLAQAGSGPLPPNSHAFGKGYDEHATGWLEWAMAAPAPTNPILDPDGSYGAMGQSGKVWYLAGTSGGTASRSLTVPAGTALFFPIVNSYWVNLPELGDAPWSDAQEAFARAELAAVVDTSQNLVLEIDGKSYAVTPEFRVPSTVGNCVLPVNNLFVYFGYPAVTAGPHECVSDGYWALLPPLSVGKHTIRFAGGFAKGGFALDVTYQITVKPRQKLGKSAMSPHH
jgi:hypothetical protein